MNLSKFRKINIEEFVKKNEVSEIFICIRLYILNGCSILNLIQNQAGVSTSNVFFQSLSNNHDTYITNIKDNDGIKTLCF